MHLLPKLSLTIHKAIHHNSPDYLASLLHLHTPITPLQTHSSNTVILTTPHLHKLHSTNIRSLPSLPLTTGIPYPITYEQIHQLSPLNATLRLITSPLPSLLLNNSLTRTADCSRTDAVHKQKKVKQKYILY